MHTYTSSHTTHTYTSSHNTLISFLTQHTHTPPHTTHTAHQGSLALVDCDAQSDVCTKHSVSIYPSARIYRGGVDSFTDYNGILDSTHMLNAIGQETLPMSTDDVVSGT